MLAIAAPDFYRPSETFIRNHVRTIAPGKTVLVCKDGMDADLLDCPMLEGLPRPAPLSRNFGERAVNGITRRWRSFSLGMAPDDEDALISFLREYEVRALLVEYLNFGILFGRAANRAGVPLFVHAHGYDVNILGQHFRWRLKYKLLFKHVEAIICGSEFIHDQLNKFVGFPDKLKICQLGVDTHLFHSSSDEIRENGKLIVCVSRLIPQKGVDWTIRAFSLLLSDHPDAELEIVGEGPDLGNLVRLASDLGISGQVTFHGSKSPDFISQCLRRARVFAQHCVTIPNMGIESFGLSVVEAMASSVPVVVTRHGAMTETVVDGENGFLVEERDVDRMAAAIAAIFADPSRASAMGQAGRLRVLTQFSHQHSRDRLRSIMGFPPSDAADMNT